jgi:hypothetical protein
LVGGLSSLMTLAAAGWALLLIDNLGRRYRASHLGELIAGLPFVRLIPYAYRKYWLPSGVSLRPRPPSFYFKRLIIRQSEFLIIFYNRYLLNSASCSY